MCIARLICNFFQWLDRLMVWPGRPTLGLLSLAAFSLLSGAVACSPIATGALPSQTQAYTFYIFNPLVEDALRGEENMLVPLDPQTLNDQPDGQPLEPGRFSVSGSTRVDVEYPPGHDLNNPGPNPDDVWIVIHNLQTGTERSRFHPPVPGLIPLLSQDGTRLVIQPYPPTGYPLIAEWYVVDTTTGQSLAHIKDADTACFRGGIGLFDPALQQRVYCPVEPDPETNGPKPLRIIAYGLESGEKAAEVELP